MQHEVSWGRTDTLDDRWWLRTPPTVIMRCPAAGARGLVVGVLLGLGYSHRESYVFGTAIGAERFYTGEYVSGPIESALRYIGRRPRLDHVIGFKVLDRDRDTFQKLADLAPRIEAIGEAYETSHASELIPSENLGAVADLLLKLLTVVSEVKLDDRGFAWPPVRVGSTWQLSE